MSNSCEVNTKAKKTFKEFIKSKTFWKTFAAIAIGGTGGFLYYYFVGCANGSCGITSNPYSSIAFGSVLGLFFSRTENVDVNMSLIEINKRYSELAEVECCLSCGGAINYAKAKPGEVCVDLGSGKGTDVLRLSDEVGENGFVYGIDISEGMLEKARMNAQKFGISNVEFVKSTLESITLGDQIADLVISNCTINHSSDKQKVWNEIYRILKKGGRFVVSDIYAINKIPKEYRNDPVAVSECWAGSVTRDVYMETLKNAGFINIEVIEESAPYRKGKVEVASFTIAGLKKTSSCCCSK